jgi:4'-phosphopantetheinyl transferase
MIQNEGVSIESNYEFAADAVHVWMASLDLSEPELNSLCQTLSAEELARGDRFHFDQDKRRFQAAHGILRTLLSSYMRTSPQEIGFTLGVNGKPAVQAKQSMLPVLFNLSHSADSAVFAFSLDRQVGVDLERLRVVPEFKGIMEMQYSRPEILEVLNASPDLQNRGFLRIWTRKEAFLKAAGTGLLVPLKEFDTSEPPRVKGSIPEIQPHSIWEFADLELGTDWLGAIAVEGVLGPIKYHTVTRQWLASRMDSDGY